ncbi:MAG: hypothetical protein M3Q49_03020 [Actinomycetota bacterium]|nr:hypothetical protein [Actinomycetota bacterium]MDP9484759.1 hypothetical protein [Actinomycetota bacterium]
MKTLPEICESCRRKVEALERVVVPLTREVKRVAQVSFRESVTEGVRCMECVTDERKVARCKACRYSCRVRAVG